MLGLLGLQIRELKQEQHIYQNFMNIKQVNNFHENKYRKNQSDANSEQTGRFIEIRLDGHKIMQTNLI